MLNRRLDVLCYCGFGDVGNDGCGCGWDWFGDMSG